MMMRTTAETDETIAYIDGANLHKGIRSLGWCLDYHRFRSWMRQKYGVSIAKLFIGRIPQNADLYADLRSRGFRLIFKEVVYDGDGKIKGNCDADLVLHAAVDAYERRPMRVLLISSDGDYAPLIRFWKRKQTPCVILSLAPMKKCSWLLRKTNVPMMSLDDVKKKIGRQNEKAPGADVSVQGPSSW